MNTAILLVGSNIDPLENSHKALALLRSQVEITAISQVWEIPAVGSPGPNFLNFALEVRTGLSAAEIKTQVIGSIETALHRVRSSDKYAPRTIDIDIILFNEVLLETELWNRPYVALPVSDLRPDLTRPLDGIKLCEIAGAIMDKSGATVRRDLAFA